MSTLTITIGIVAPVITLLIGRYFRSEKIKQLNIDVKDCELWKSEKQYFQAMYTNSNEYTDALKIQRTALLSQINDLNKENLILIQRLDKTPKGATVQIVPNINPHHSADTDYVGIYPNNGLEPAHLTREEYQKGVDRLKNNPEDNILTKPVK
jgi:hypothetical protein